jgi:5-hydroxyisourate hydrolase-like protein (transthyretin family)
MRNFFLLFWIIAFANAAHAQSLSYVGKIEGHVVDSSTKQPVAYATVTIYASGNAKPVNGAATNNSGRFEISGVKAGTYKVVLESIGYNSYILPAVTIKSSTKVLGTVSLLKKEDKFRK